MFHPSHPSYASPKARRDRHPDPHPQPDAAKLDLQAFADHLNGIEQGLLQTVTGNDMLDRLFEKVIMLSAADAYFFLVAPFPILREDYRSRCLIEIEALSIIVATKDIAVGDALNICVVIGQFDLYGDAVKAAGIMCPEKMRVERSRQGTDMPSPQFSSCLSVRLRLWGCMFSICSE